MPDPVTTHLAENYQAYGILIFSGGLVATVKVNRDNIRELWSKFSMLDKDKTDKESCDKHQKAVQDGFREMKDIMETNRQETRDEMEELRVDRRNSEQRLFDHMRQNGVNK